MSHAGMLARALGVGIVFIVVFALASFVWGAMMGALTLGGGGPLALGAVSFAPIVGALAGGYVTIKLVKN